MRVLRDRLAPLLAGDLVESDLRICSALGDDRRAHMRRREEYDGRTACGKLVSHGDLAGIETEESECRRAGRKTGCPACVKRTDKAQAQAAATRAFQIIARDVRKQGPGVQEIP